MPSKKNIEAVKVLQEKFSQAKNLIIADYTGLNVDKQNELREKVSQAGGEFSVAKNTLIQIALKNTFGEVPEEVVQVLQGPTAILYGFEDAVGATKAIVDFSKENDSLNLKIGMMTDAASSTLNVLTQEQVKALSELPSKDELRARVVSQLNAPIQGFVNVLSGNLRGLVQVLVAIKDQKEK